MKPGTKNILLGVGIAIALGSYLIYDSIDTALSVFDNIKIKPASFPKKFKSFNPNNLGIDQNISFDIDVKIENPDSRDFSVSGYGIAVLKQVDIYFKNIHLGTANLALEEINVPAKSSIILRDIPFVGNTLPVFQNATAFSNLSISDLRFTGVIEAAGNEYLIG